MSAGDSARGAITTPSSDIRLLYIDCRAGSVGSLNVPGTAGGPMMRSSVKSLRSPRALDALSAPPAAVVLANPLAEHQSAMRTSLLPGLLDAVSHARRHGERDVREFTVGPVFLASTGGERALPDERLRVAFVLAGDRPAWLEKPKPFDVWDASALRLCALRLCVLFYLCVLVPT